MTPFTYNLSMAIGLALIAIGLALIDPPLALVSVGALIILLTLVGARFSRRREEG